SRFVLTSTGGYRCSFFIISAPRTPLFPLFPYTTLFRSCFECWLALLSVAFRCAVRRPCAPWMARPSLQGWINGESANCVSEQSRSEEHTSELQSRENLVCRLLLEKKNNLETPSARPTAE